MNQSHDLSTVNSPQRILRLWEAIALVVGIVIGAGIFKAPSMVAGMTGDAGWMFGAWLAGGVISLIGALCYAELATAYPHTGGDYHFLQRAYGRSVAFLFGWARFSVITTGSIALLAFVFGDYMNQVIPLDIPGLLPGTSLYAGAAILLLSWINLRGTRTSATTQTWLTALEITGLLLIVTAALSIGDNGTPALVASSIADTGLSAASLGLAMVFVLLTYGGWNEAAYISAELKDTRRDMVKALIWSIAIITLLYLLVTWAYWKGLGVAGMAKSDAIAADLLTIVMGPAGGTAISIMIAISALTSINATMIVGARTSYALGHDWPQLHALGLWDGERDTPANALRIQCIAALLLVAIGTWTGSGFRSMVEFTAPVFWLFFLLAVISLFVLRSREPHINRPFKVPLFPLLPLLFCATCIYMLWSSLSYVYSKSLGGLNAAWIGVAVLAAGGLLLLILHVRRDQQPAPSIQSVPIRRHP